MLSICVHEVLMIRIRTGTGIDPYFGRPLWIQCVEIKNIATLKFIVFPCLIQQIWIRIEPDADPGSESKLWPVQIHITCVLWKKIEKNLTFRDRTGTCALRTMVKCSAVDSDSVYAENLEDDGLGWIRIRIGKMWMWVLGTRMGQNIPVVVQMQLIKKVVLAVPKLVSPYLT